MPPTQPKLSSVLPPLICGTATFNSLYNEDPYALPTTEIVNRALQLGVRAFDSSPYYGPAEELLGQALSSPAVAGAFPRSSYLLLTKVGRLSATSFDYSPAWVRQSVARSLARLRTAHLDVVYCHDVEFVAPAAVLAAVRELRRLRDATAPRPCVRYIGISGYPAGVLADLAELVLRETGEPLDAVMSYANFTLQSRRLLVGGPERPAPAPAEGAAPPAPLARLVQRAGVDVVPNASVLGMGLLRRAGVPVGGSGDFHPAPPGLRAACARASAYCDARGERLEVLAIRWALEQWLEAGGPAGGRAEPSFAPTPSSSSSSSSASLLSADGDDGAVGGGATATSGCGSGSSSSSSSRKRLGVSVVGVSNLAELEETVRVWRSVLDGLGGGLGREVSADEVAWSRRRRAEVEEMAAGVARVLGEWLDVAWESPGKGFVNTREAEAAAGGEAKDEDESEETATATAAAAAADVGVTASAATAARTGVVVPAGPDLQDLSKSSRL